MSTRSVIARPTATGFAGVYHHWDGYPEGVGASLFGYRNGFFGGDTEALLAYLIDQHPAGWSTINGKDLAKTPGFVSDGRGNVPCIAPQPDDSLCGRTDDLHLCQTFGPKVHGELGLPFPCVAGNYALHLGHAYEPDPALAAEQASIPECYCHGSRSESPQVVTEADAAGSGCEWAYVLDGARMTVLASYTDIGSESGSKDQKMIGFFGMGDGNAEWRPVAVIDLDGPEPDWSSVGKAVAA